MKSILVVCDQSDIDVPLRKSLGHLVKSCEIKVASDGYQAFDELSVNMFDLIVIDSEILGIDSLELVESVEYIDPGIPVILMLQQANKSMWSPARALSANPILRPFKPITFLRLVDTLLHEYLERYRELADSLESFLEMLGKPTQAAVSFLVDGSGQPLISTGEAETELLETLGSVAVGKITDDMYEPHGTAAQCIVIAQDSSEADHALYVISVIDNLYLGLVLQTTASDSIPIEIRQRMDLTAKKMRSAIYDNIAFVQPDKLPGHHTEPDGDSLAPDSSAIQSVVPLQLNMTSAAVKAEPQRDVEDESSINWGIIQDSSNLLNRLQDFCQID